MGRVHGRERSRGEQAGRQASFRATTAWRGGAGETLRRTATQQLGHAGHAGRSGSGRPLPVVAGCASRRRQLAPSGVQGQGRAASSDAAAARGPHRVRSPRPACASAGCRRALHREIGSTAAATPAGTTQRAAGPPTPAGVIAWPAARLCCEDAQPHRREGHFSHRPRVEHLIASVAALQLSNVAD